MALYDVTAHRIMALHDTRPVDCLAPGTHRHRRLPLTEIQEIVALHSLSLEIVIGHVTSSLFFSLSLSSCVRWPDNTGPASPQRI